MGAEAAVLPSDSRVASAADREVARRVPARHGPRRPAAGHAASRRGHDEERLGFNQHHRIGRLARGKAVTRSGARPGDILYVSGRLGRAQLGLELAKSAGPGTLVKMLQRHSDLLQPHLYPQIRVELGAWLARQRIASAMMDISDGLSTDLARMCRASGVGARLWAESIPCVKLPLARTGMLRTLRLDPMEMALHGGEDYELLFTVPRKEGKAAPKRARIRGDHGDRGNRAREADHAR